MITRHFHRTKLNLKLPVTFSLLLLWGGVVEGAQDPHFAESVEAGKRFDAMARSARRVLHAWLQHADPKTLLLPDQIPGKRGKPPRSLERVYRPHNSGADLYPYLILTAAMTDPDLLEGRMMEMLRNEVRFTTRVDSIPGDLDLDTGKLGPMSLFGAAEYAKDGLVSVTELLGRTPWFYRMVDMMYDLIKHAPVPSRFGNLPSNDSELNGDVLQVLVRLAPMTGEQKFWDFARRIGDAYIDEVLPGNSGLPSREWDFETHSGKNEVRLRDHGNEVVLGLVLLYALENDLKTPRAEHYRPVVAKMLDRILESANPDGLLYDVIDPVSLKPLRPGLSDNWGYVYGAVYTFYQCTGEDRYREAVLRVLHNLPKYRNYAWEGSSFDGYADSIESALYLVAREPVKEAWDWIESETDVMVNMQKPSGFLEYWYGEGNFNRTLLLYMFSRSQGCRPDQWVPGLQIGATREGDRLFLTLRATGEASGWKGRILFDFARHRRVMNLKKNYVRLNEFPEWYVVDENTLYRVCSADSGTERVRIGSELIAGISLEPGDWLVEPLGKAPYGVESH
ncbi:MAG: hypothetical protein AB1898_22555 [Acidobacteriota bacterium]